MVRPAGNVMYRAKRYRRNAAAIKMALAKRIDAPIASIFYCKSAPAWAR